MTLYEIMSSIFQLTTSRRGRPWQEWCRSMTMQISTHDLTKRSTLNQCPNIQHYFYFNSRPHEEVDEDILQSYDDFLKFQLTTSRRGRLDFGFVVPWGVIFQLTTSRRGRRWNISYYHMHTIFQLTTSRRGRHYLYLMMTQYFHFNSRPHEEVDKTFNVLKCIDNYFNSRPHEEVDYMISRTL